MTQSSDRPLTLAAGHRHFDHRLAPFLAIERGWFREAGLIGPIQVIATGKDDNTVAGLIDGTIELGLDISPAKVIAAVAAGHKLVMLGSMQNGVRQVLVARPGIKTVEALRGRRIHLVEQGTGVDWHPLRILLRKHGLDPDQDVIQVCGAPFPAFENADAAFRNDLCDARMMLLKEAPALRAAGYSILHDFSSDYPAEYPQRCIVTTGALLNICSDEIEALLEGIIRAYRFMADGANYDACMEVVGRNIQDENLGFPPGYPLQFHRGWGFKRPADGGWASGSLERYLNEEILEGRALAGMSPTEFADTTPLARVVARLNGQAEETGREKPSSIPPTMQQREIR